jgi:hypothetical protein
MGLVIRLLAVLLDGSSCLPPSARRSRHPIEPKSCQTSRCLLFLSVWRDPHRIQFLSQPALSEVPGSGPRAMARRSPGRTVAGALLLPPCLHHAVALDNRCRDRRCQSAPRYIGALATGIVGPTAGFNSHSSYRPTRLRSIRLQRRPATRRTRRLPRRGTSLNPHVFIPTEVARHSGMISPTIPISCRSAFRDDFARHSGMKSPG